MAVRVNAPSDRTDHLWRHPASIALLVTACVGALGALLPEAWAANAVAVAFFGATYVLVLRRNAPAIASHGLSLGGIFEPEPLNARRMLREFAQALAFTSLCAAVCFPTFVIGYQLWWRPTADFNFNWGESPLDELATQVIAIALPEEMFYRGYLQSALERRWPARHSWFGGKLGLAVLVTSVIFALGHLVTVPHPARLSVFFPSLLFGWLRCRTGGIGASVLFHASCNLLALYLGRGYGFFQ
jgi:uncharacterized protein